MSRNVNGVIFDLDGTLLDTREVIARSLQDVIKSFGINVSLNEMLRGAHKSPYTVLNRYVSLGREDFRTKYWKRYQLNIRFLSAFLSVRDLLEELRRRRYKIGIATSLPRKFAERGLQLASIGEMVDGLVAYSDTESRKPYPEPVIEAAKRLSLNPQETLYIGDRPVDIKAGKEAKAYTGAAMWGLNLEERNEILKGKPNYVFERTCNILDVCREESVMLPCIAAIHFGTNKNCALFEKVDDPRDFCRFITKAERRKLMKDCFSCFKKVIVEIPEYCCNVCRRKMEEERYKRYSGICYWCNEMMKNGELFFEKVFAIGQERTDLDYAIKAFKGVKGIPSADLSIPLGIIVSSWLFEHRENLEKLGVNMLLPVPSSDERIKEVGFDHISEILVVVQSLVDFTDINFLVLSRCRDVRLKDLGMEERAEVIKGAFAIEDKDVREAIHGKSILILDDVFTTGATTNECAKVLKENGARKVYILAISRRYRRQDNLTERNTAI
ncbi:MAG: HAD-IA family hydrolase [Methanophagales archaeon]|nr:HAD-IA family hydrolase [Methanophagales archaeon]